jgi:hypothetical protein
LTSDSSNASHRNASVARSAPADGSMTYGTMCFFCSWSKYFSSPTASGFSGLRLWALRS